MNCDLSVAVISDLHLGHRKTPTEQILRNLEQAFPDTSETANIDVLFIPGDVFDRLLNLPDETVYEINRWIAWLLYTCKKRDVVLRVLEGTPSHDWRQSRLFDSFNIGANINADAKHMDTLCIEWIERLGIHVLYVPDEWCSDTDQTWEQVQQCLRDHGIEQVDFTIMHGQFSHQLPDHVEAPTHDPDRYADVTRHWVFCGHVHSPSTYRNILVPGSFDRLAHGEEEQKGHWRLHVTPDKEDRVTFIENRNAKTYLTVNCHAMDAETTLQEVSEAVDDLEPGSYVRIRANRDDSAAEALDTLKKRYPGFQWDRQLESDKKQTKASIGDAQIVYQAKPLTKETIPEMVDQRLKNNDTDDATRELALSLLSEVL